MSSTCDRVSFICRRETLLYIHLRAGTGKRIKPQMAGFLGADEIQQADQSYLYTGLRKKKTERG